MQHSQIHVGAVELHVVETGVGQPVLLCHGFPDVWRGWRRQMEALVEAGYRAIALDMRGYGGSSAPDSPFLYTPFHTVGDLVGLLDALEIPEVTIVGHDFGASVAWNAALMRPDRFTSVFGVSVPFLPRGETSFLIPAGGWALAATRSVGGLQPYASPLSRLSDMSPQRLACGPRGPPLASNSDEWLRELDTNGAGAIWKV